MNAIDWIELRPGEQPRPGEGEIHLWRIDLDAERDEESLSAQERARAQRFRFARDRRRFISGRAGLRRVLAGYAGGAPRLLPLAEDDAGKPVLSAGSGLAFSFSRSAELAVAAVAGAGRLGVDIEELADQDLDAVARQHFSAAERLELAATRADLRRAAFYRGWTGKEALVKATGEGLNDRLSEITLRLDPRAPLDLLKGPPEYQPGVWRLVCFEPRAGIAGAAAFDRQIGGLAGFHLAG